MCIVHLTESGCDSYKLYSYIVYVFALSVPQFSYIYFLFAVIQFKDIYSLFELFGGGIS